MGVARAQVVPSAEVSNADCLQHSMQSLEPLNEPPPFVATADEMWTTVAPPTTSTVLNLGPELTPLWYAVASACNATRLPTSCF